jgi:hypothetical protein
VRAAAVAFAIFLGGCAMFAEIHAIQEVDNWVRSNEPLAESGKLKWSEYYVQYLERVSATPVISQGPVVERLGILIAASLFYEQGRLEKADFDTVQRISRTYETIDDAAANKLARDALVRALEQRAAGPLSGAAPR